MDPKQIDGTLRSDEDSPNSSLVSSTDRYYLEMSDVSEDDSNQSDEPGPSGTLQTLSPPELTCASCSDDFRVSGTEAQQVEEQLNDTPESAGSGSECEEEEQPESDDKDSADEKRPQSEEENLECLQEACFEEDLNVRLNIENLTSDGPEPIDLFTALEGEQEQPAGQPSGSRSPSRLEDYRRMSSDANVLENETATPKGASGDLEDWHEMDKENNVDQTRPDQAAGVKDEEAGCYKLRPRKRKRDEVRGGGRTATENEEDEAPADKRRRTSARRRERHITFALERRHRAVKLPRKYKDFLM